MIPTLEKKIIEINGMTCANQIRAMQEAYVPDEDEKCRHCNNYNQDCYVPVSRFEIPLNHVRFAR